MIVEAIDKVADISRDYLVAPTATTAAPAVDILPKPWPEFIMAVLFIVVTLAIKSIHKHHKLHKAAKHPPGGVMYAGDLRRGDTFIECSAEEWASMTPREQKKAKRVRVVALGPACRDKTRVHLTTDAGNWCIPHVAEVMYAPVEKPHPKSRVSAAA